MATSTPDCPWTNPFIGLKSNWRRINGGQINTFFTQGEAALQVKTPDFTPPQSLAFEGRFITTTYTQIRHGVALASILHEQCVNDDRDIPLYDKLREALWREAQARQKTTHEISLAQAKVTLLVLIHMHRTGKTPDQIDEAEYEAIHGYDMIVPCAFQKEIENLARTPISTLTETYPLFFEAQ